MISADEALEYGNMTLTDFLKADKDQNIVFPSESLIQILQSLILILHNVNNVYKEC